MNASAEAVKAAVRRAEARRARAAETEAESLRSEVRRRDDQIRVNKAGNIQKNSSSRSTALVSVMDDDRSRAGGRLTWGGMRAAGRVNEVSFQCDRSRGRSVSPECGDCSAVERDNDRTNGRHNRASSDQGRHLCGRNINGTALDPAPANAAPPPVPPPPGEIVPFTNASIIIQEGVDLRRAGHRPSSDSDGVRNALTASHPEWGPFARKLGGTRETPSKPVTPKTRGGQGQCQRGERSVAIRRE